MELQIQINGKVDVFGDPDLDDESEDRAEKAGQTFILRVKSVTGSLAVMEARLVPGRRPDISSTIDKLLERFREPVVSDGDGRHGRRCRVAPTVISILTILQLQYLSQGSYGNE